MAYSVQSDLENLIPEEYLIELTDDNDTGEIDEVIIRRIIDDADSEIDLYCGKKYEVPFTTIYPIIRKLSVDIAIYNLYGRRRSVPESAVTRYTAAIEMLKAIRDGDIQIEEITEVGPASSAVDVKPEFTKGKYDHDDNLLGDMIGRSDGEAGSLDDW